jgi:glycosyltransferase involved in cell wall biosynthesis
MILQMKIDLIFIAYNRLEYTKLALTSLLSDPTEEFSLTIWDNGSTDGTREYLSSLQDLRIVKTVFASKNMYLHGAVNDLLSKSSADLIGIIPDDFLVTPGWTRTLAEAHAAVPEFGIIGCWHLAPEDFDYERAKHKIQRFGQHKVLRHPWTGGGAGLVKLKAMRECGLLQSSATTRYWIRMALKGYVNGFYFPLIYVEHMDYPWSKHYAFSERLQQGLAMSVTARNRGINNVKDAKAWHETVVRNILDDPWQAKYYVGWRSKLRRGIRKTRNFWQPQRF